MNNIKVCLQLKTDWYFTEPSEIENRYLTIYKPLLSYLYSHPKFYLSMCITSSQLELYEKKFPEALKVMGELIQRHQLEVFGTSYYNAFLPLLVPQDRSGQIEKMSSLIRTTTGKRPRGFCLFKNVWSSCLISTMHTCGIEYFFIDSSLLPEEKNKFVPLVLSEMGKSVKVIPVQNKLEIQNNESFDNWINRINSMANYCALSSGQDSICAISVEPDQILNLINSKFFSVFEIFTLSSSDKYLAPVNEEICFTTPGNYMKYSSNFLPSYIPSCMEKNSSDSDNIFDYLNKNPSSHRIYDRMMYVSNLLNSCKGDKIRKQAARELNWSAQNGLAYLHEDTAITTAAKRRQIAYRALNQSEKIIRESGDFVDCVSVYEYNGDGLNEYICQMEKFHAVISLKSGSVNELDCIRTGGNYADTTPDRAIFTEHLFDKSELDKYLVDGLVTNFVFSHVQFTEKKFEPRRNEIQLHGRGLYSSLNQPVFLKKKYLVSENGFIVQYILKNESPLPLKGTFVVESNFSESDLADGFNSQFEAEIIEKGERVSIDSNSNFHTDENVSVLQLTDIKENTSFVFEPNEESGMSCLNIGKIKCISFYWNIELAGGMEMEKTINLSIVTPRKSRKKSN